MSADNSIFDSLTLNSQGWELKALELRMAARTRASGASFASCRQVFQGSKAGPSP
jgi:hypothetical protein